MTETRSHDDCARVCRVLAAQMNDAQARFERCSSGLIATLDQLEAKVADGGVANPAAVLQATLDELLFVQAQEHDLIRQMMGVVSQALALLPEHIDIDGLAGLYISDSQRAIHREALQRAVEQRHAG